MATHPARGRVLVVDDDADAARLWMLLLERAGFEVLGAHCGEQAIVAADDFVPDVALLDVHIGDVNGHDLGLALRARLPDVGLVALTGDDRPSCDARSVALGFDAHLVKPVLVKDLLRVVDALMLPKR